MRKILDGDSKTVSSQLSSDFQQLFLQCNEKELPTIIYEIILGRATEIYQLNKSYLY